MLVDIYAPSIGAPKYVQQASMGIKGEIDRNTDIVEGFIYFYFIVVQVQLSPSSPPPSPLPTLDFNTPLTSMDRSPRQGINKVTAALNDTLDQMDLIDSLRAFHPKAAEYTFFSSPRGTFSRIDHMFGHKTIN